SLDLLTGGRVELGLAADDPEELGEALAIIHGVWDTAEAGRLRRGGIHHRVRGIERGPAPAHRIPVHLGGSTAAELGVAGEHAQAWFAPAGLPAADELAAAHRELDTAAIAARRDPREIGRVLTLRGLPERETGARDLVALVVDGGISTIL